jgi:hypothetical protein
MDNRHNSNRERDEHRQAPSGTTEGTSQPSNVDRAAHVSPDATADRPELDTPTSQDPSAGVLEVENSLRSTRDANPHQTGALAVKGWLGERHVRFWTVLAGVAGVGALVVGLIQLLPKPSKADLKVVSVAVQSPARWTQSFETRLECRPLIRPRSRLLSST